MLCSEACMLLYCAHMEFTGCSSQGSKEHRHAGRSQKFHVHKVHMNAIKINYALLHPYIPKRACQDTPAAQTVEIGL